MLQCPLVRLRIFLSIIQVDYFETYVHRTSIGSRALINLNTIGLCFFVFETQRYELSALLMVQPSSHDDDFKEFACDNTDVNVYTLDGHDMFHAMGEYTSYKLYHSSNCIAYFNVSGTISILIFKVETVYVSMCRGMTSFLRYRSNFDILQLQNYE